MEAVELLIDDGQFDFSKKTASDFMHLADNLYKLLFGMTDEELQVREIERRSGFAVGTIQTELRKLSRLDLVAKHRDGKRTLMPPDVPSSKIFLE